MNPHSAEHLLKFCMDGLRDSSVVDILEIICLHSITHIPCLSWRVLRSV